MWLLTRVMLCLMLLFSAVAPVQAVSTTWLVDRAGDDAADGSLANHRGTLRFALSNATSGDFVQIGDVGADALHPASTLVVPSGVSVGHRRDEPCGDYLTPLLNIDAAATVNPVVTLYADATWRNINIGGGDNSVKIAGSNVDLCGAGLGLEIDGDGARQPIPPRHAALIIDGSSAIVHRNYLNGPVVVTINGSDSRLGGAIDEEGESNDGVRNAAVTILADSSAAAQRVTIRDAFPRALHGIVGTGIAGGDDIANHANHWAQTPTISRAISADNYATVQISGSANPNSLVDIYIDNQITIARQQPVLADASGVFSFTGQLEGASVKVYAASTLNDLAHAGRIGSSSQWAGPVTVQLETSEPVSKPLLAATGRLSNLSGPAAGPAHAGDTLRYTVTMTNVGTVDLTALSGSSIMLPAALSPITGTGSVQGGTSFVASDDGFNAGILKPGKVATYTLDLIIASTVQTGTLVLSQELAAKDVVIIPIVARMRVVGMPAKREMPVYLPLIVSTPPDPIVLPNL